MTSTPAPGTPAPGTQTTAAPRLSCYTANLAEYLAGEPLAADLPGADQWLAESVRLAVRIDLPGGDLAFSHHRYPIDRLPDETRLRYTAAPSAAGTITGLRTELDRHGRVLVVTDSAQLPWSPAHPAGGPSAPHWLLVTAGDGENWQVCDCFAGLLAADEQRPFAGALSTAKLLAAMTVPQAWTAEQQRRNELAFGFPIAVPAGRGRQWLRRVPAARGDSAELPGSWLTDDAQVLPFLAQQLADRGADAAVYLDDLWSAAAHRVFRYQWLARQPGLDTDGLERLAVATEAWARLPVAARFAVDSARRGRPRASLLTLTFGHLLDLERSAATIPRTPTVPRPTVSRTTGTRTTVPRTTGRLAP